MSAVSWCIAVIVLVLFGIIIGTIRTLHKHHQ